MALRSFLEQKPVAVVAVCAVLLLVALALSLSLGGRPQPELPRVWFYDLETGDLFAASDELPPIDAPSGASAGVRAHVFACGDCSDPDARFVGWIETYPPETRQAWVRLVQETPQNSAVPPSDLVEQAELGTGQIRSPDGGEWVPYGSRQAQAIRERAIAQCQQRQDLTPCLPE